MLPVQALTSSPHLLLHPFTVRSVASGLWRLFSVWDPHQSLMWRKSLSPDPLAVLPLRKSCSTFGGGQRDFRYFQQQAAWCRFIPDVVYLTRSASVFVAGNLGRVQYEMVSAGGESPAPLGFFSSLVLSSLHLFVFRLSGGVARCRGESFGPAPRFCWSPPTGLTLGDGSGPEEPYFAPC